MINSSSVTMMMYCMSDSFRVCRCCREPLLKNNDRILCSVCRPWNNPNELLRLSMPAWQNYLEQHQKELMRETREWLRIEQRIIGAIPYAAGWAELLRKISGNDQIYCSNIYIEDHRDYEEYLKIREVLVSRKSKMFPGLEADVCGDAEIEVRFNGHNIRTSGTAMIVDGARVSQGPGTLLFMMMLEKRAESVVRRFLDIFEQIEGNTKITKTTIERNRREALRGGLFSLIGSSDAPQPESKRMKAVPAPLCDWSHDTYLLGIEIEGRGRHVIPLPTQPDLLEKFLTIWNGRPSMYASDRLQALSRHLAIMIGIEAEDARITPLERSFSLLRSVIDTNSEFIEIINGEFFVKGRSGVTWRVKPGEGAHGSPYLIQTSNAGFSFGQPICMYDDAKLPLGDRLASVVLGLLNDNILRTQYEQIHYAIIRHEQRDRHMRRSGFLNLFP